MVVFNDLICIIKYRDILPLSFGRMGLVDYHLLSGMAWWHLNRAPLHSSYSSNDKLKSEVHSEINSVLRYVNHPQLCTCHLTLLLNTLKKN